jgi:hypothetical protein
MRKKSAGFWAAINQAIAPLTDANPNGHYSWHKAALPGQLKKRMPS